MKIMSFEIEQEEPLEEVFFPEDLISTIPRWQYLLYAIKSKISITDETYSLIKELENEIESIEDKKDKEVVSLFKLED